MTSQSDFGIRVTTEACLAGSLWITNANASSGAGTIFSNAFSQVHTNIPTVVLVPLGASRIKKTSSFGVGADTVSLYGLTCHEAGTVCGSTVYGYSWTIIGQ